MGKAAFLDNYTLLSYSTVEFSTRAIGCRLGARAGIAQA
jgi:hypothetical protein